MIVCTAEISVLKELIALLPEALQAASAGFCESRKRSYLTSRALLYQAAAYFFKIPEPYPVLAVDLQGKPFFRDLPLIKFNLTHSRGFVAAALAACAEKEARARAGATAELAARPAYGMQIAEQGIDLEFVRPYHNFEALKERVLGPQERSDLDLLPSREQRREFTALWTVRECLLKASGRGLGGLDSLEVDLQERVIFSTLNSRGLVHCLEFPLAGADEGFLSWFSPGNDRTGFYVFTPQGFEELEPRGERVFTVEAGQTTLG